MSKQVIFYGAGQYARENLDRWLANGLTPVCFADADESKHYKRIYDQSGKAYDILSLEVTKALYPDYELRLTLAQRNLSVVYEWLVSQGIPPERIKCADQLTRRQGCPYLDGTFQLFSHYFWVCCYRPQAITVHYENIADGFTDYLTTVKTLTADISAGKPTSCDGCPNLKEGFWSTEYTPKCIIFSTDFEGDGCNFNCRYCHTVQWLGNGGRPYPMKNLQEVIRQLSEIPALDKVNLSFADGEVFTRRDIAEVLALVGGQEWTVSFTTNGSIYKNEVEDLIRAGRVTAVNISLDAGTSETFAKVKGVDCFGKVAGNLKKYAALGVPIDLKYIMLAGLNDNEHDIDSFADIAASVRAHVWVSGDQHINSERLAPRALAMVLRLIQKCSRRKNFIAIAAENFHPLDLQIIEAAVKDMQTK
ncbi:MAG: radical SAM protein [Desulfarculales bacterium]|jgi:pyruvate-formate lyase-activating enzyme|nr:radical SAM protein [Desulfarculales bacterium]